MNIPKLLLLAAVASFSIAACDSNDGPAEKTGAAIDKAGDKIGKAATDVGNAIEDACEKVKEGVDAKDTNC